MKKRILDLRTHEPILDIAAYGRKGPGSLTREQRELLVRTVRRTPEVVVKVSGGARTLAGVEQSFRYYGRKGKLDLLRRATIFDGLVFTIGNGRMA